MTPVISPWFFYLYHLADGTGGLLMFIGLMLMFICFIFYFISIFNEKELEDLGINSIQKKFKWTGIVGTILLVISILIPNQTTLIQMLIAKNITYENIAVGADYIEDLCSNIINITIEKDN